MVNGHSEGLPGQNSVTTVEAPVSPCVTSPLIPDATLPCRFSSHDRSAEPSLQVLQMREEHYSVAFVTIFSYSFFKMGAEIDLARIKQNPKGVRFQELEKVILGSGFKRVNIKGSHYVYKKGNKILTVVKPHAGHKHCHWLDVKDVLKVLEED